MTNKKGCFGALFGLLSLPFMKTNASLPGEKGKSRRQRELMQYEKELRESPRLVKKEKEKEEEEEE